MSSKKYLGDYKELKLFKNDRSYIHIVEGRMYIWSTSSNGNGQLSIAAITVLPGFQIELGRSIQEIIEALRHTRLPVVLELSINIGSIKQYTVIRTATGKVESRSIATLNCENDIITAISFNRSLLADTKFRNIVRLSLLHQLALPSESNGDRKQQVIDSIRAARMKVPTKGIEVTESNCMIYAVVDDEVKLKYTFIANNNREGIYELSGISLV